MVRGQPVAIVLSSCIPFIVPALVAVGCGGGGSRGSFVPATTAAATTSGTTAATTTAPPVHQDPLDLPNRLEIARAFAPRLRFNAWHNDGNNSPQNRNEDLFPMGVASFLAELHSHDARVMVQGSRQGTPSANEVRSFSDPVVFGADRLTGYPRDMAGDPPGSAPLYVTVYDDAAQRALAPDGSGQLEVWANYWVFYPHDRAEARIFSFIPLTGTADFVGHRSDWEHVQFKGRVTLGPGSVLVPGGFELLEGYYYGHGSGIQVPGTELERLDHQGNADPRGTHPVVYIAQGKHASYPQAGHWRSPSGIPTWLAEYTDFFRGNGVIVDAWTGPLFDLAAPAAEPGEFSSAEFLALVAASPVALTDWTAYRGKWGPDEIRVNTPFGSFGTGSPSGPVGRRDYQDFGGRGSLNLWSDLKARNGDLTVYADQGIVIPQVVPAPLPVRR